ncbi:MAG TPA: amidohydrolase family protein [Pyrinomonadaceae bacterium]|nr:amidohydrolase family protein [Pyrinomonadaceae bacterium]
MTGIVDSHQHFWQLGRFDYPWMTPTVEVLCQDYLPSTLQPILNRCGIEQTILVQASNSVEETRWLLSLADHNSFIAGVVGWVDLQAEDVARQLDDLTSHPKFKGVRHLVESEPADDWLARPNVIRGLAELARRRIAYDLLVHTRHLEYARRVAQECPGLSLVVDHMAKPSIARHEIDEWRREIKKLAVYPNVSCKLSGLVTEADHEHWRESDLRPYVETALEYFGARRMMFGSDWPVCLLAAAYDRVLQTTQSLIAELNSEDRERIFSKNAMEFYQIGGIGSAAA